MKRPEKRGDSALLDRLRRAMGASQLRTGKPVEWQELAKVAGLGASTMTDITTLDRRVTIPEAVAFADYLGVEFAWLAAGRGPMLKDLPVREEVQDRSPIHLEKITDSIALPKKQPTPKRRRKGKG